MNRLLVNIDVPDVGRAEAFYCEVFELAPARRFGGGAVELVGLESPIYLLQKAAATDATPIAGTTRSYDRHWCPVHLDVVVENLDSAVERALRAGAVPEGAIRMHDWGRIAQFSDPFGHGFCLLQFLGRGYDEIAD
jgi:predicted enzyme related to lactoylglutathione lyase